MGAALIRVSPAPTGGGGAVEGWATALDWSLSADNGESLTTYGTYALSVGDCEWVGDAGLTFTAAFDAGGLDIDLANFTSYLALVVSQPLQIDTTAIDWTRHHVVYDVLIDNIDLGVTGDSVEICISPSGTALEVATAVRVQLLRVVGGTITAQVRKRSTSWGSSADIITGLTMGSIMLRVHEHANRITLYATSGAAGALSMVDAPTDSADLTEGGTLTKSTRFAELRDPVANDYPDDVFSGERRVCLRHTRVGGSASSHSIATWVQMRVSVFGVF